jgi:multiple sugar transport system substrate-binding protein
MNIATKLSLLLVFAGLGIATFWWLSESRSDNPLAAGREEVVFWHFWGGADRQIVEDVVRRFNESQSEFFVRAVAMPGNNLDLKFFLSVTGGDPPDLLNIDDPVIADWALRGAIQPLNAFATREEIQALDEWLVPAAQQLGKVNGRYYALCNGLDIRALYYNQTMLTEYGLQAPKSLDELDAIAQRIAPAENSQSEQFGYLPDSRRLWAWGIVFGGEFYATENRSITADHPPIVAALEWMNSYRQRYGADRIARYRHGDQSLPGKEFPLLAGRYAIVMDGQWRVRDIRAAQNRQRETNQPVTQYGVCPLPPPAGGEANAGWANGNVFLVPRGARQTAGAWAFMKFWSGFGANEAAAATTCVAGGWIPVSTQVAAEPEFQQFLHDEPLFAKFVELAASPHQVPIPVIPAAGYYNRQIKAAGEEVLLGLDAKPPLTILQSITQQMQQRIDRSHEEESEDE